MIGSETKGFSGSQFCLGVESLYHSARELAFSTESVQQKLPMTRSMRTTPFKETAAYDSDRISLG
jgi:hypothetical protein